MNNNGVGPKSMVISPDSSFMQVRVMYMFRVTLIQLNRKYISSYVASYHRALKK